MRVIAETVFGMRVLRRIPEDRFPQVVWGLLIGLCSWLLAKTAVM